MRSSVNLIPLRPVLRIVLGTLVGEAFIILGGSARFCSVPFRGQILRSVQLLAMTRRQNIEPAID